MNDLELVNVQVGRMRIGGFLGHGLHMVLRSGSRLLHNRTIRRSLRFGLIVGILSVGAGHVLRVGLRSYYENAAKSPVIKNTYTVEDVRGLGDWLVVRTGTKHLKLHCVRSRWIDGKDEEHQGGSCPVFTPGETVKLEKWESHWDGVTYIYRMQVQVGESEYTLHRGDDE
jgi:hypothetical protein